MQRRQCRTMQKGMQERKQGARKILCKEKECKEGSI